MKRTTLFLLLAFLLVSAGCSNSADSQKTNVLLIIIDTLSADHLGCYDYTRDTSPTIDSLADSGILFLNCQAQAPWTLPAMATIFTGLSQKSHGCGRYNDNSYGLDPEVPTLATILAENGFSTAALFNVGYLSEPFGMAKGYEYFWIRENGGDNADMTVDTLLHHFSSNSIQEPFFTTIHFFDPHLPYNPPAPFDTLFKRSGTGGIIDWPGTHTNMFRDPVVIQHMTAMYDSEIRWTDSQVSRLLVGMREMNLTDNTLIIVIADHGEEFMQHGDYGHGSNLYQESLHVPLILSGPGIESGTLISQNVGQFDLLPTVLGYLDIPIPAHVEGVNVLEDFSIDRVIPSSGVNADTVSAACFQNSSKVIWLVEPDSSETYNLADDPGELNMLPTDNLLLEEVLEYWAWPCICKPTQNTDEIVEMKRLLDLGYIR